MCRVFVNGDSKYSALIKIVFFKNELNILMTASSA